MWFAVDAPAPVRPLKGVDLCAMTAPATGTAILILVGFVLPGFVAVLLKERLYEVRGEESTFDRLLTTVYYSVLVFLLPALGVLALSAFGVLDRADLEHLASGRSPLWLSALIGMAMLLVLPALAALGAWRWMGSAARRRVYRLSDRLNVQHRTPTSWDFAFDHGSELKDGSRLAGYYGRRSHSGYGTRTRDLFLEELWDVAADDGSISPPPAERHSVGIWIDAHEIRLVEQYATSDEHQREIEQHARDRA
jgi:hypothetical protein